MELNFCFPRELQRVKDENIPVVICGGTVEYHGAHCAYGCDSLVAEGLVKKLAEKKDEWAKFRQGVTDVLSGGANALSFG